MEASKTFSKIHQPMGTREQTNINTGEISDETIALMEKQKQIAAAQELKIRTQNALVGGAERSGLLQRLADRSKKP